MIEWIREVSLSNYLYRYISKIQKCCSGRTFCYVKIYEEYIISIYISLSQKEKGKYFMVSSMFYGFKLTYALAFLLWNNV